MVRAAGWRIVAVRSGCRRHAAGGAGSAARRHRGSRDASV
ncbi:hypothetical protein GBP346_B3234 [Burkholderia pseudomallei MSHR346]|nr:hypothetical protein GBP346_B3234 [Burkholderia pseudomallei MSHR346]